ncbi:MAG: hypothetical protein EZS28_014520 [Streblomastix strix]|uniref:Uncharacterized protein n=1 Tax=Streblomastix strix TaxID=222440 RepID=A0A5J4W5N9_9EUKA|nr:MAG: hypothetical protein EZS28_014520 [Streblomastix strix]
MMLHDFHTQFDAVEIDLIKKNPSRNGVAEKINIQWLERFVGYKKLSKGHVVDQKKGFGLTQEQTQHLVANVLEDPSTKI